MFNIFDYSNSTEIKIIIFQYIKYDYWYLKILIQIYQNIYSENVITLITFHIIIGSHWLAKNVLTTLTSVCPALDILSLLSALGSPGIELL